MRGTTHTLGVPGTSKQKGKHLLNGERFIIYGGTGNHGFDAAVLRLANNVTALGLEFSHCWHSTWPDGEPGFRIENPKEIRGRHAVIFSCPVTYKLVSELRDLVTACKHQYGAKSVTVILSFMCYRRQDHDDFYHEITRLRWFIRDLKHWGADELIVCEPHSSDYTAQYCNEFGLRLRIADPSPIFADAVRGVVQTLGGSASARIYSPDFGSIGRALALAAPLGLRVVATPKRRVNMRIEVVSCEDFMARVWEKFGANVPVSCDVSDLSGLHMFMREDELDTGGTAVTTARMLQRAGAVSVRFIAAHPVCSRGWKMRLFPVGEEPPFQKIWLGNTRPRGDGETDYEGSTGGRVERVNIAPCVAATLVEALSSLTD